MTDKSIKKTKKTKTISRVNKKPEFEAFINLLRGEAVYNWSQIATALGVEKNTITEWKKLPQAQKAIRDGIEKSLEGMTKAGKDEWRMWESKLKMLGVSPVEKADFTSDGEKISIGVVSYQPKK